MKKIKTFEAPLKKDWEKKEYIEAHRELCKITKKPFSMFVFCYNCKKEIKTVQIHVVNFGKDVACGTCYRKKWSKIRNRIGKFMVPDELADDFVESPNSEQLDQQVKSDQTKALDAATNHCEELKSIMKTAEFKP